MRFRPISVAFTRTAAVRSPHPGRSSSTGIPESARTELDGNPAAPQPMTVRVGIYLHTDQGEPLLVQTGADDDWHFPSTCLQPEDDLLKAVQRVTDELGIAAPAGLTFLTIAMRPSATVPSEIRFVLHGGRLSTADLETLHTRASPYQQWATQPWDHWEAVLGQQRVQRLWLAELARRSEEVRYFTSTR